MWLVIGFVGGVVGSLFLAAAIGDRGPITSAWGWIVAVAACVAVWFAGTAIGMLVQVWHEPPDEDDVVIEGNDDPRGY
jgi:ascorbate-specific PTS system EIIC-type component UlaA